MRDRAYEASLALSAFGRVLKGHTALTSECGTMLEEVQQHFICRYVFSIFCFSRS